MRPAAWRRAAAGSTTGEVKPGAMVLDGQSFPDHSKFRSGSEDERADDAKDKRDDEDTQGCGKQLSRIERGSSDRRPPVVGRRWGNDRGWQDDIIPGPVCNSVVLLWLLIAPSLVTRWSKGWRRDGPGLNGQRLAYKRMGSLSGFKSSKLARGSEACWCTKERFCGSEALVYSVNANPEFPRNLLRLIARHNQTQSFPLRLGQLFDSICIAPRHKKRLRSPSCAPNMPAMFWNYH